MLQAVYEREMPTIALASVYLPSAAGQRQQLAGALYSPLEEFNLSAAGRGTQRVSKHVISLAGVR